MPIAQHAPADAQHGAPVPPHQRREGGRVVVGQEALEELAIRGIWAHGRAHQSPELRKNGLLLAVEHEVDSIVVTKHGGRQLDTAIPSIEALPEIVEAVAGRCEIYLDGGIRRGTDILKALALGARAVLIGRPVLWGLAVNGAEGVYHVLELLRHELELAMALSGRPTLASIDRSLVRM